MVESTPLSDASLRETHLSSWTFDGSGTHFTWDTTINGSNFSVVANYDTVENEIEVVLQQEQSELRREVLTVEDDYTPTRAVIERELTTLFYRDDLTHFNRDAPSR